jgi:hypothetical protein
MNMMNNSGPWPFPGQSADEKIANSIAKARKSIPGTYATGKGTSARIIELLKNSATPLTAKELGDLMGVPARQLSKRLTEQERKGKIAVKPNFESKHLHYVAV